MKEIIDIIVVIAFLFGTATFSTTIYKEVKKKALTKVS